MKRNKKILPTILISLTSAVFADDVASQNNNLELDDIQVVATRKLANSDLDFNNVIESGEAIPAISKSKPVDTVHGTTYELNDMPGISIVGGGQTVSQSISIGGLDRDNVIVGIDGVNNYFSNFGGNNTRLLPSPYLFKSVTASQSGNDITYGSGNIGGAVDFTTIDPEDILHGDKLSTFATVGGNSATTGANLNTGIAAKTGQVSYLLDIVGSNDNDMTTANGSTLPYSANQNFQGLAKIAIDISKSQSLKLTFLNMQNVGQYPMAIVNNAGATNPPANFNYNQTQTTIDYRYNPDNPYFDVAVKASYQTSNYAVNPIDTLDSWQTPQNIQYNTGSIKVQNTTKVAWQKLLYGIEATNITASDAYNGTTVLNFPNSNQQLYGAFLQDSWDITKQINITAGTRYNAYTSTNGTLNNSGSLFTNQIGINYHFLPDWLAYAAYSEGFQAPTLSNLYLDGYHQYSNGNGYIYQPNPNLQPEVSHNKSIGIKYDSWFTPEQHMTIDVNGFLNDVSNYVLWTYAGQTGSTSVTQMSNIGSAQLYGYSVALQYTSPWVLVNTNFTSTYGATQDAYTTGSNYVVPAGAPLPIPQAKGYLGLGFPIEPVDSVIKTYLNYALTQTRTPVSVYGNLPEAQGYAILGLAYDWKPKGKLKGMSALIGVDNLLDSYYQNYNGYNMYPAMGRNIYAQIGYKY